MNKSAWRTFLPEVKTGYAPWLQDRGSLTQRIRQRCARFEVHNLYDGLMIASHDETILLGSSPQKKVYAREVFLLADKHPVVFAHSVVAPHHLRGAWQALQHLGSRPLAALLFSHPLVHRAPLHYRKLKANHPLYRRAVIMLDSPPPILLARRSLFSLRGASLLVTEVFLPHILYLAK